MKLQRKKFRKEAFSSRRVRALKLVTLAVLVVALLRHTNVPPNVKLDAGSTNIKAGNIHSDAPHTRHTRLYIITCETRDEHLDNQNWLYTATKVQDASQSISDITVSVQNICVNVTWVGFKTKFVKMREFLETLNPHPELDSPEQTLVIFTDADVIFNPFAVSAPEIINRFHQARHNKPILIGAESNCWVGSYCSESVVRELYPESRRSDCPQFVNSGAYMGFADSMLQMFHSPELNVMTSGRRINDQHQLAIWYAKNRDKAQLDIQSTIFRNLVTGLVDSNPLSKPSIMTCGLDGIRNCSEFKPPYMGYFNESNSHLELPPFPTCSQLERRPFAIHGAGPRMFKQWVRAMVSKMQQANP